MTSLFLFSPILTFSHSKSACAPHMSCKSTFYLTLIVLLVAPISGGFLWLLFWLARLVLGV